MRSHEPLCSNRVVTASLAVGFATMLIGCGIDLPPFFGSQQVQLDLSAWSVVEIGSITSVHSFRDGTLKEHPLFFIADTVAVLDGAANDDGLLVTVASDGVVHVSELGDQETALRDRNFGALAAAWSSQGDRLAVLARDGEHRTQKRLLITTGDLELVGEFTVDLPGVDGPMAYVVSWDADDTQIAVSTERLAAQDLPAECVIVDVASGTQQRLALSNVYFVAKGVIVGTTPGLVVPFLGGSAFLPAERLRGLKLENGQVVEEWGIPGDYAAASRPKDRVFAVWLWSEFPLGPMSLRFRDAALTRSADAPGLAQRDPVALFSPFSRITLIAND